MVKNLLPAALLIMLGILMWWLRDTSSRRPPEEEIPSGGYIAPFSVDDVVLPKKEAVKESPRRITVQRRQELLHALAQTKLAVALEASEGPKPPASPTKLTTKQYIRERMDEIKPLLEECYQMAKAQDSSLSSRIPVAFTIEGDPDVGGLITEVSLLPTLANPKLTECMRETLYTLEIDPPEEGGDVSVVYPFDFEGE
jgi:hypothetical protein